MAFSILVTGASGFIGSFIVREALKQNFDVWAGIRINSSKNYLRGQGIRFLELDFSHPNELRVQLMGHKNMYNKFDYIVHCAGVSKTNKISEFDRVNYLQTKYFIEALAGLNMIPKQFVYISSLSIFGPIHEEDYSMIKEEDAPIPNTAYGMSKLKAELCIKGIPGFPYVIFRPTGVYGPRETDYYLLARSISRHIDFTVGSKRQDLTFIYVKDLVNAIFLGIEKNITQRSYILSDGNTYPSCAFSDLIRKELGNPFVFRIKCPLFILKTISLLAEFVTRRLRRVTVLNRDKYKIMRQRNWRCDISPAVDELGYAPAYTLEEGVKETIAWYKNKGWL